MAGYYGPFCVWIPVLSMFYLRFGSVLACLFRNLPCIFGLLLCGCILLNVIRGLREVGSSAVTSIISGVRVVQAALLPVKQKKRSGSRRHPPEKPSLLVCTSLSFSCGWAGYSVTSHTATSSLEEETKREEEEIPCQTTNVADAKIYGYGSFEKFSNALEQTASC